MNTKMMYAAGGGIAVVAVIIFFVLGAGGIGNRGGSSVDESLLPSEAPPIEVTVNSLNVTQADVDSANVRVAFLVANPNQGTVIFERISYAIVVDGIRMTGGDIGSSPAGFVDSQGDIFPIVSNSSITLKDTAISERNSRIAESWDKMVAGETTFTVEGEYSYRHARGLETAGDIKSFSMTYP